MPAEPPSQPQQSTLSQQPSALDVIWEFIQTILLALVIFLLIRNVVQNYRIDGISMEPNFHNGQFLFVNRFAYCPGFHLDIGPLNIHWEKTWCIWPPRRGDVIIFEYPRDPSRDFIKRVIGLPGETVEVKTGRVYINGKLLAEPFGPNPGSYTAAPVKVGPDEVYVMGDNRNNSSDSHMWGPLPQKYIIGKAWISYWPPKYWAIVPHYDLSDLSAATP
jgi:signal peptidase I